MDGSQRTIKEIRAGGERTENLNQQKLDDATFEPKSYIEQTGDFKQSEAIQNAVVGMVNSAVTQAGDAADVSTRSSGQGDTGKTQQPLGETGTGGKDAITIGVSGAQNDTSQPKLHTITEQTGDHSTSISHPGWEPGQKERHAGAINFMLSTAEMQEMQMSFNLQYLMLQNKISQENRQFSMLSNIMKNKHDTAKNSINNIR
jgi:hypothetical protein